MVVAARVFTRFSYVTERAICEEECIRFNIVFLMAEMGITKSHSRPYVSNDSPYSESQFKTLKYRPEFLERFGAIVDAGLFCQPCFR
jgi:hypothetical protein